MIQSFRCRSGSPPRREALLRRHGRHPAGEIETVAAVYRKRSRTLVAVSAVILAAGRWAAEFIVFRETFWRNTSGIGTVSAPVLELLHIQRETATRSVDPRNSVVGLERRDVGQPFFLVPL